MTEDVFGAPLPNELPIPLAPKRIKRPALDLLTGLELGLTLPKTESLKPCKYWKQPTPVEIDDCKDDKKQLSYEEAENIFRFVYPEVEDIFRFLFPEADIITNENIKSILGEIPTVSTNKNLQSIQDGIPVVSVAQTKPKKKKRAKRKKLIGKAIEPIIKTPPEKPKLQVMPRRKDLPKAGVLGNSLTGLELGLTLPKTEILKPCKYRKQPVVGILIEIEKKKLSYEEAENIFRFVYPEVDDIFRFLFPEADIIPNENIESSLGEILAVSINKNLESIQDEIPVVSVGEIEPIRRRQRKKKTSEAVEPMIETRPEKPKQLQASMMPRRKDLSKAGVSGKKIQIFVNMLAIEFGDNLPSQIEQYHVSYEPEKSKSLTYKAYLAAKSKLFPEYYPAYSEGRIFSAGCLPIESPLELTVKAKEHDDSEEIEVKITIVQVIRKDDQALDFTWMKNIQESSPKEKKNIASVTALQIIMNSVATNQSIRGNSYFIPPEYGPTYLGSGLEMGYGLFQSVTIGWKPFLKVDVVHKGFLWNMTVIDYVKSIVNQKFEDLIFEDFESKWDLINEKLVQLRVSISCNDEKRCHQLILSLINKRPRDIVYQNDNGAMISLRDYFLKEKNYEIRYPDLPCLLIANRGNQSYVPMELCTIEGQESFKWSKLSEKQQENFHKASITNAKKRRRNISHVFKTVHKEDDACLKSFNVSVSREFEKIEARILEPPTLYFYQNQEVKPEDGVWNIERFQIPTRRLSAKDSWSILNFSSMKMEFLFRFSTMFMTEATKLGLQIGMPKLPCDNINPNSDAKYIAICLHNLKILGVQLVVVVLPDRLKNLYSTVKQVAELHIGILTQCVNNTTIEENMDEETVKKILMKVNAKLQGTNYSFIPEINRPRFVAESVMILGADVTHPKSKSEPSIAALVASYDPKYFQYSVELRFQPPGVELIGDLQEMMREQLLNFYRRNLCLPMKIIFYRDGVGEGEFRDVMNTELLAIRRACLAFNAMYQPPITFMIVQKRIHTRFFPVSENDIGNWNYNVKVGTVVDTVVTHPTDIDFILVSHQSLKGTTNPTKYRCLWDDSNLSEDALEQLTYYLCHMFTRCNKSVKYPAPTYYAHLAAARGRVLSRGMNIDLNNLHNEQIKLKVHSDLAIYSPMYFL